MSTTPEHTARRSQRIRLVLAAVAVLGIGAALTSAAWTDDAWFTANATAGEVELEGRPVAVDPEDEFEWQDADEAPGVEVPAGRLTGLVPEETREFQIEIRNASTVPLYVTLDPDTGVVATGELLDAASGTTISTDWTDLELAPDATETITVTVVTGDYDDDVQGSEDGTLTLTFSGTTDLP